MENHGKSTLAGERGCPLGYPGTGFGTSQLHSRRSCPAPGEEESTQDQEWGGRRSAPTLCDPHLGPDPASLQTRGSLRALAPGQTSEAWRQPALSRSNGAGRSSAGAMSQGMAARGDVPISLFPTGLALVPPLLQLSPH